jgi:hypothetical protein
VIWKLVQGWLQKPLYSQVVILYRSGLNWFSVINFGISKADWIAIRLSEAKIRRWNVGRHCIISKSFLYRYDSCHYTQIRAQIHICTTETHSESAWHRFFETRIISTYVCSVFALQCNVKVHSLEVGGEDLTIRVIVLYTVPIHATKIEFDWGKTDDDFLRPFSLSAPSTLSSPASPSVMWQSAPRVPVYRMYNVYITDIIILKRLRGACDLLFIRNHRLVGYPKSRVLIIIT